MKKYCDHAVFVKNIPSSLNFSCFLFFYFTTANRIGFNYNLLTLIFKINALLGPFGTTTILRHYLHQMLILTGNLWNVIHPSIGWYNMAIYLNPPFLGTDISHLFSEMLRRRVHSFRIIPGHSTKLNGCFK